MKLSWSSAAIAALLCLAEATPTGHPGPFGPFVPVQSYLLRKFISKKELIKRGQALQDIAYATPGRNRLVGTPGHVNTVKYLVDTLSALNYYDVSLQPFTVELANGSLSVNNVTLESSPFTFTPDGDLTAPLVVVPNLGCNPSDFPASVAGNIALISRGNCTFAIKNLNAKAAGAVGAVVYQTQGVEGVTQGTLGEPGPYIPVVGISYADGQSIISKVGNGTAQIADLFALRYNVTTNNVIAETKKGDKRNVLVVGAHSDSVAAGPGINDNGSGSIGILEVAVRLANFRTNNAVRFAWWSAEEEGLLGAEHYVQNLTPAENQKIRLYLNFDMIASPNYVYEIYDGDGSAFNTSGPPGSAQAEKLFQDYIVKEAGGHFVSSEFDGRSDYGPFLDGGIAAGGLGSGADGTKTPEEAAIFGGTAGVIYDPNYHTNRDVLANTNSTAWYELTKGIAHAVAVYGDSWKGFPKRNGTATVGKRTTYKRKAKKPVKLFE